MLFSHSYVVVFTTRFSGHLSHATPFCRLEIFPATLLRVRPSTAWKEASEARALQRETTLIAGRRVLRPGIVLSALRCMRQLNSNRCRRIRRPHNPALIGVDDRPTPVYLVIYVYLLQSVTAFSDDAIFHETFAVQKQATLKILKSLSARAAH